MTRRLHVIVPGPLDQKTGGYVYVSRMVAELGRGGWGVEVHELPGRFPDADPRARTAMEAALSSMPNDALVLLDGLAMGGLPDPLRDHADRLRLVALVHHPLADETGLPPEAAARFEASEREALASCRGAIVTSAFTARRLEEYGVPIERIRVAVPGTAPVAFREAHDHTARPLLLCVATVTPRKGHDVLIAALERIRDLSWRCVCAGSLARAPVHAREVADRILAAGLADRVTLLGEVDEDALQTLYASASVFVLASRYEGYGMVLTEALAHGLPVVGTTGGAVPDTVPEGAGILVPPGDDDALAAALRSLLTDPPRRAAMADVARRAAERLPRWEASAAGLEAALLALGAGRTSA